MLTKAVEFSGRAQTDEGGWGYVSAKDGDGFDEGSTTITQVQGLRGCRNAGIPVPKEIIDKAIKYIHKCTLDDGAVQYSSKGGGGRPAITAAAIACLFNAGDYDDKYVPKMLTYAENNLTNISNQGFGHWHYAHYYYAQVMYREGGEKWEGYRDKIYPRIVSRSDRRGRNGIYWTQGYVGPVYTTAVNLTILQLENNSLPIYQRVTSNQKSQACECRPPTRRLPITPTSDPPTTTTDLDSMTDIRSAELVADDSAAIRKLHEAREKILQQLSQVIVGQNQVIEELLISLFSRGHCLLEGVPGLAKTLMISTLARALNLSFSRIQFTPDLMPADITGTEIIEENRSDWQPRISLSGRAAVRQRDSGRRNQPHAAENAGRAAGSDAGAASHGRPRAASAARSVLRAGHAESDRAGRHLSAARSAARPVHVQGVREVSEFRRGIRNRPAHDDDACPITSCRCSRPTKFSSLQRMVREVPVTDHVIRYTLSLVRQTRVGEPGVPDFVNDQVSWGAGPRAVQFLILGGKARALLHGRTHVSTEDIQALAKPVLRHRLVVNFAAESEGVTPDDVVERSASHESTPTKGRRS